MRFMSVMLGLLCLPLLAVAIILSPVIVPVLCLLATVVPGLAVLKRTSSKRSWNLASYHSPHSLTWRWILSLRWHQLVWPKPYAMVNSVGFGAGIGTLLAFHAYRESGGWQWEFSLLWHGLSFSQQRPMWYRDMMRREWDDQANRVNSIEALARDEYQEGVSAGAAVRQVCRSLSRGSTLKRMLEDMLADGNRAAHDRHCILRDFKAVAPEAGRAAEMESFRRINRIEDEPVNAWPNTAMPAAIQ